MNLAIPSEINHIIHELRRAGHLAFVVGGAVRDSLLGLPAKDLDVEVYGITYDRLVAFLSGRGRVDLVGKSFGVVKFTPPSGNGEAATFDFSIPRRDSKVGISHRDFEISFDPAITPEAAASRRDFTINAMSFDPVDGKLFDFFDGQSDLRNGILRATTAAFAEDPLRVLRGMQFACRFNLAMDPATAAMCQSIADQYSTLAKERVAEEFMKWALKSPYPGLIGPYLRYTGWSIHFPEITALYGVHQDPEWHPEGDVGVHTMYVLNEAARIADREGLDGDQRAVLLFSALCHDFAKPATTVMRERGGRMRWSALRHEELGAPMARTFLERLGIKAAIVDQVEPLVEYHLAHMNLRGDLNPRTIRRLATRLVPASIAQLVLLVEADVSGRPPRPRGLPPDAARLRDLAAAESVKDRPPQPLILGRHVLPFFDGRSGKHVGEVTHAAYEAQLDGVFSDEQQALQWLDNYFAEARESVE
jgi:tRNA nucleotidyltransferase (CCA-adding enzyme)